jgi:hypothetical protein
MLSLSTALDSCLAVRLQVVYRPGFPGLPGTMGTAEKGVFAFDAMTHDLNPAMIADRGKLVDGALEAVENVMASRGDHLERKMIVVSANLTSGHIYLRFAGLGNSSKHQPASRAPGKGSSPS